jgi:hypothetical protein
VDHSLKSRIQKVISNKDLQPQLEIFEELAVQYLAQAKWNDDMARLGYLRASGIYNYCINLCKSKLARDIDGNIKEKYLAKIAEYKLNLQEVEKRYLQDLDSGLGRKTEIGINTDGHLQKDGISSGHDTRVINWDNYQLSSYSSTNNKHKSKLFVVREEARKALMKLKEDETEDGVNKSTIANLKKAEGIVAIYEEVKERIKDLVK